MKTTKCIVCGQDIGIYGWPSHVAKEKRKYGPGIYTALRKEKTKMEKEFQEKTKKVLKNKIEEQLSSMKIEDFL